MKKIFWEIFTYLVTLRVIIQLEFMAAKMGILHPEDRKEILEAYKSDTEGIYSNFNIYQQYLPKMKNFEKELTLDYLFFVYKAIGVKV